jgi:hypothetical protein
MKKELHFNNIFTMRKIIFTLAFAIMASGLFAQKVHTISLLNSTNEFSVIKNEPLQFKFKSSFSSLKTKEIVTKEGFFIQINTEELVNEGENGSPSLPVLKRLIEVPFNSDVKVNIVSFDEEIISLNDLGIIYKIIPQQPSVRKDQNVADLPFHYNQQIYSTNDFIENAIGEYQPVGIMRGVNIGRIVIRPVQYNPAQNTIRILKNIVVEVTFKNADLVKTESMRTKYYSPMFESSCKMLANYNKSTAKDNITIYPVKYLIISHRMFEAQIQPFIQWKTRKGFKVTVAYTDVIGTTTTAIKSYITAQYTGGTPTNPAPSYILLIGDVAQIPAFTGSALAAASPTDLYYGEMDGGSDVIPDIYYGRFSAQNADQLAPQLAKTLQYEQYTMPDPSFLQYSVLVAGVDGSNAATYGNGQINYANLYTNASNGITPINYLYGSGSPIISNSTAAAPAIHQNVSDGAGFVNYTAHCGSDGWSDPSFNTSHVAALTNQDKYCFMIGNCCQSNMFSVAECFGEAILRAPNKGAVGYIGASDFSYWNEDYYFAVGFKTVISNPVYDASKLGFYDKLFHSNGEAETDWHVSAGQLMHGGNLAVTQGGTSVTYYWEEYHLMGDPSLMPYLGVPTTLSATYLTSVPMGVTSVAVATEPYAYVGLSLNNVWIDAKYTGASGNISLDLTTIAAPCTLDVVITKQNRQPNIGTIVIVPNSAPYVVYNTHVLHDAGVTVNGNVEYSETVNMDLTLRNVGSVNATGVNAALSTTNTNINITDNYQPFGNINATATATQNNSFAFNVANVIPDQQIVQFVVTATDATANTWTTNFNVTLNAPVLQATTVVIDDVATGNGNGRLDPGETVTIKILTLNNGHAVSPSANTTLTLNSGAVSIPSNTQNIGAIVASGSVQAIYTVNVNAGATVGSTASFTFDVNAGGYTATKSFVLTIGLIVEDFESNTFTEYPWNLTQIGNAPWTIINSGSIYEGAYSARSGIIGNIATSELTMQINVLSADSISFYKKVNSEQDYDFLKFYIDGIEQDQWSGIIDWSREAYMMATGIHTIKWIYSKDYSVAPTGDGSWVDFVIFPPINLPLTQAEINNNLQYFSSYPNPFNSESIISYSLIKSDNIAISLINTLGETVKSILPKQNMSQGSHQIQLSSEGLASGIYLCKMETSTETKMIKIILSK